MIEKIYFDMDGVLVDFENGIQNIAHVNQGETDDEMWLKIKEVDHFYYKLKPLDNQLEVLKEIRNIYGDIVEILTAIPKPKRNIIEAKDDKIKWIVDYIGNIPYNIVYSNEKKMYAINQNYILIDDSAKNIKEWEEAGGTGIYFEEGTDIIKSLKEYNSKPKVLSKNI
jgi:FMN phosphatase YigB (HAD superfamily)